MRNLDKLKNYRENKCAEMDLINKDIVDLEKELKKTMCLEFIYFFDSNCVSSIVWDGKDKRLKYYDDFLKLSKPLIEWDATTRKLLHKHLDNFIEAFLLEVK